MDNYSNYINNKVDPITQHFLKIIPELDYTFKLVNKIYIDMELLQDFKLGALLSTVTVKEEVEYIMSCLPVYNLKFNNRTAEYFPVLKKTDEELLSIVKNNSIKTALLSPWTKIYNNLNVILKYLYF